VENLDEEEIAVAIHRALVQGCDDGTYFGVQDDGLVIEGRINLLIVARELRKQLRQVQPSTH
jgi:hypothetical protein